MAPQQCPKCNRDHVLAAHKDFPPKKNAGETVRKTPAKTALKAKKKKPAIKKSKFVRRFLVVRERVERPIQAI